MNKPCRAVRALLLAALALALAELATPSPGGAASKRGGAQADALVGTGHADFILGAGGDDALYGRAGADRLVGGRGADKVKGDGGADWMLGGVGADRLLARDGSADTIDCGPGLDDVAVVDAIDRVAGDCELVDGQVAVTTPVVGPMLPTPGLPPAPPTEPEPAEPPDGGAPEFEERPLETFPFGHGWTGNGNGTFADVGPPFVVNGDRSYGITTDGSGAESVATSPALEPVDLAGTHVSFQAQVSFSNRLGAVKLRLASGDIVTDYAEVTVWEADHDPIILGSSFEFQSLPLGAFEVSGEVDWSQIDRAQIILTDNATGPVGLYVAGIYALPTSQTATLSFAFDDGYASTFTQGLKKLSTFRYPATAYVIADAIGGPGMLSLEQLEALRIQHHWEIGGHSLTVADHNLPNGLDDLEPAELKTKMDGLRDWLDGHGFPRATFAYPKGAAGKEVRQFARRDYCAGRSTARGPETIPSRDDYTLRGWSINGLVDDAASVEAEINEAVADGTWLMLSFHDIVGGEPSVATEFDDDDFKAVVNHVRSLQKAGDLRVRTVAGVIGHAC